jgi:predicted DNA-binding ribbon-helix-helix protein
MSKTIELPDELYRDLEKVARERGLTLADWIAGTLPGHSGSMEEQ